MDPGSRALTCLPLYHAPVDVCVTPAERETVRKPARTVDVGGKETTAHKWGRVQRQGKVDR